MSNDTNNTGANHPLVAIAGCCGGASCGIAAIVFLLLHNISDAGMWAIAVMVAAPSAMGCGIAYFMFRQPGRDSTPPKP